MSEKRDKIAKILAREYWQGRIESVQKSGFEDAIFNLAKVNGWKLWNEKGKS